MQAHRLPASRGWYWIRDGFRLWRQNPLVLSVTTTSWLMLILFPSLLPLIGPVLAYLLLPPMAAGMARVCHAVETGAGAQPSLLFSGFHRDTLKPLLILGGIMWGAVMLVMIIAFLLGGGPFFQAIANGGGAANLPEGWGRTVLLVMVLLTPVYMAYWYAPALIRFRGLPPLKAAFFSLVACWRNVAPFTVFIVLAFGLLWFGPVMTVGFVFRGSTTLALFTLSALLFGVLLPVFQAACYVSLREVFSDLRIGDERI